MPWNEWVASLAALLTTACFIPQAWKAARHRKTQDLSLLMYVMFSIGVTCWLIYGLSIDSWPMIIANIVTLSLSLLILAMKLRHG
jgi:MtN3 and saliva related transmembrane protein